MNFKLIHRITAFVVFLVSTVVFFMTVAPTLSFWDCGEFITSAVTLSVPHPPGAPFFQLIGRMFSLVPFGSDIGYRVNLLSLFSSSLTVLFTYLTAMRLLRMWHGDPKTMPAAFGMFLACATGALILSFSDTFWFNGVEAEMYGIGMFFISGAVWMTLEWYAHAGVFDTERTLLLIAYMMGLSIGIHLLSLLAVFFLFVLVYLRDRDVRDITAKSITVAVGLSVLGFIVMYPGTVKWLPSAMASGAGWVIVAAILIALIYVVAKKTMHPQVRMGALSVLLIVLGYSTYTLVVIRANDKPALNENDPYNFERLYKYLNREQYGSYPLLRGENYPFDGTKKYFPRRWDRDPDKIESYRKYTSDMDFFMTYQLGHIFGRYFMWNFVGRAGDKMDAPSVFTGGGTEWSESEGFPNRYYAIPLILGLLGLFYHFKKDWRTGIATGVLFLVLGVGLVVYFNMSEPQVRERDYFFVGSFYVFALWAGLGVYSLMEMAGKRVKTVAAGAVIGVVALVIGPGLMLKTNYQTHDRNLNYVAFDYAYNMLQSCEKDAILITGGDNDTFPLWCLQYVYGVRRDVRLVNLSLLNTEWYAKQLKNERPYGALPVKMGVSDEDLDNMEENLMTMTQRLHERYQGDSKSVAAAMQTTVKIVMDHSKLDLSTIKDVPEVAAGLASGRTVDTLEFVRKPSRNVIFAQQDSLVVEIVKHNASERPIYFATSTSPADHDGLDQYLVIEGLAWRLSPFRVKLSGGRYYSSMSVATTMRHFMNPVTKPDSNRSYGFMFRELNNPKINLDEASTKMIMTYRYVLMGLAQYAVQVNNDRDAARKLLEQMDNLLPQNIHKIEIMFKPDMAMLYSLAGDKARLDQVTRELEEFYLPLFEKNPRASQSDNNPSPVEVLLRAYDMSEQWEKAASLLEKYSKATGDNTVQSLIQNYRSKSSGQPAAASSDTAQKQ